MATATANRRTNQYPGTCPTCRDRIPAGEGWIEKGSSGRWETYCRDHFPGVTAADAGPVTPAVRRLTAKGLVLTPFERDNLPLVKSMPGARFDGGRKCWTVSLAPSDRPRLLELADRLGLDVAPELRGDVRTAAEITLTDRARERGLYPFQVEGVGFLARNSRALLADEMGLGKTVQVLLALDAQAGTVVVCPASLKYNWRDETRRWRPDLTPVVLSGKGSFRTPQPGEILITNYDVLPHAPGKGPDGKMIPSPHEAGMRTTTLVIDEAHAVKNYRAARSAAVKALARVSDRVWALTGTPLTTRPSDLYGVLESTGMAGIAFGSFGRFQRLFNARKGQYGIVWGDPDPAVPEMLRRVMLRRKRAAVLPDLPRKTYTTITVNGLSAGLRRDMDRAWDDQGDYLEVSDSLPAFTEFSALRARLATERIPQMLEIVEQHEESETPLLVFSAHRAPIDTLESRDGWATITGDTPPEARIEIVRRFQTGELLGLGLTIAAGGVGLTLTHAWKVLFIDLDWTPALNSQAEDRVVRIGQEAFSVEILRLVSDHPLERHVHRLLAAKVELVEGAVERELAGHIPAARETVDRARAERAQAKVAAILDRETARAKAPVTAGPIAPELAGQIRGAIRYLSGVCDGAVARDGAGFNQADTHAGKILAWSGLEDDDSLRAAWLLARRYPRQVKADFPLLWTA